MAVQRFIEETWWNEDDASFHGAYLGDGQFGKMAGRALHYWDVLEAGDRMDQQLDRLVDGDRPAVEVLSHYPEIFYRYGRNAEAYEVLIDLADPGTPRRDYPEVSFAVVGAVVNGLMGIDVEVGYPAVSTVPRLTSATDSATLSAVPLLGQTVDLTHVGTNTSALTNRGDQPLTWRARFPIRSERLSVDGEIRSAEPVTIRGLQLTEVTVVIPPGARMIVRTVDSGAGAE